MSGSGGGGYQPSIKTTFDCETGIIRTALSSVNLNIIAQHFTGDVLDVVVDGNAVVAENGNGEILGSILHANVNKLRECIELGHEYQATITSLTGTSCSIKIYKS
ncbi:MAG: hypothetical protein MK211_13290 [Flavobacteriales bacterium]|jgi:transcriptional regulator CtsR|nr:hypothetical protein [Flavobacteriales bacterium]